MNASTLLVQIIEILVGGISSIGTAIGEGLSGIATSVFLTGTGDSQTLSVFGVLVLIFAGISLALGLARLVINWIQGLGGGNI